MGLTDYILHTAIRGISGSGYTWCIKWLARSCPSTVGTLGPSHPLGRQETKLEPRRFDTCHHGSWSENAMVLEVLYWMSAQVQMELIRVGVMKFMMNSSARGSTLWSSSRLVSIDLMGLPCLQLLNMMKARWCFQSKINHPKSADSQLPGWFQNSSWYDARIQPIYLTVQLCPSFDLYFDDRPVGSNQERYFLHIGELSVSWVFVSVLR